MVVVICVLICWLSQRSVLFLECPLHPGNFLTRFLELFQFTYTSVPQLVLGILSHQLPPGGKGTA